MRRILPLVVVLLLAATALPAAATAPGDEPESLAQQVTAWLAAGKVAQAEDRLRNHLASHDDPSAHHLLGVVLSRSGRLAEAEESFRRALEGAPTEAAFQQSLARLLLQTNRRPEALESLRRAAALGPLERDLALQLAVLERAAGRAGAARTLLLDVIERFDSVEARLLLARLLQEDGDPGAALEHLAAARQRAPHAEEVLRRFARAAFESQAPAAAILTLEALERMHPEEGEYPYLRGVAWLRVGDPRSAAEALERAWEVGPRRALTASALAIALNGQNLYDEAHAMARQALLLAPDDVEALAALAEALQGRGELEEAERQARRALAIEPQHAPANLALGMILLERGDAAAARQALERSVVADGASPKAHYQLSRAYARLGERERSQRHVELYRETRAAYEAELQALGKPAATP